MLFLRGRGYDASRRYDDRKAGERSLASDPTSSRVTRGSMFLTGDNQSGGVVR